ncbi:MAG TPA: TIGR03617 family F420-dependent LLM class oxidoreductase [Acidimicrobiales bacterium]|nr:TIGR03617 family F420-dependent LLM class oxidoreductase [Acidimicrobiales bacterium]
MQFDWTVEGPIGAVADEAAAAEAEGYDGVWIGETNRDPFVALTVAAGATTGVSVGSAIAVAFARSPMNLAYMARDLQELSGGRFVLGLGTQVQAHVERRFSMPWSRPVARMREMVLAIRAIWEAWQHGTKLRFEGDFYSHTLMTPFFAPPPLPGEPPPVYLAGVGQHMTEAAGEVADGFLFHAFTTPDYLRQVTIPALRRGRERAGKSMDGFVVCGPAMAVVADNDDDLARGVAAAKDRVAFYASTPAYRPVLDAHGWGHLQGELADLARNGQWAAMGPAIDDDVLAAFAVVGTAKDVAAGLRQRYGDVADRLTCYSPAPSPPAAWRPLLDAAREDD